MSLNWKEINAVLQELQPENSFVQKIYQISHTGIVFELYKPGKPLKLFIDLSQKNTRIHALSGKAKTISPAPRFVQFLRSHIQGGRITECRQIGEERIIAFTISKNETKPILWVRLWGGVSNIIVTNENGTILETYYRRKSRNEISGETYTPENDIGNHKRKSNKTYQIRNFPGQGTLNNRIEEYYNSIEKTEEIQRLRNRLDQFLKREESRLKSTLRNLKKKYSKYENAEVYKQLGDIISAHLHEIKKGHSWITAENFYNPGEKITIELDPAKTGPENAELYYKEYSKASSGIEATQHAIRDKEEDLEKVYDKQNKLLSCNDIETLRNAIQKYEKTGEKKEGYRGPGLRFTVKGYTILAGRNAKENDELLRKHVRGNDLWLHARDFPGGYVFIKTDKNKQPPPEVVKAAGQLAVYYSKAKKQGEADLYYTQVKYLRRVKDGKTGKVIPTQEKNIYITLDKEHIKQILEI